MLRAVVDGSVLVALPLFPPLCGGARLPAIPISCLRCPVPESQLGVIQSRFFVLQLLPVHALRRVLDVVGNLGEATLWGDVLQWRHISHNVLLARGIT